MMRCTWVLVCCLLFIATASSQYFSVSSIPATPVGIWSDYVFVEASVAPNSTATISIAEVSTSSLSFSTTQLQYDASTQAVSFQIKASDYGAFQVSFTINGDNGLFSPIPNVYYSFTLRSVSIESLPYPVLIGQPSEPIQIYIDVPSVADLIFSATSNNDNTISFSPSQVTIPAGELSATFTFLGSFPIRKSTLITWDVSGQESDYYDNELTGNYFFQINLREITIPEFSGEVLLSQYSTTLYVYTPDSANQSFTVTPQAADTIFTPSSYDFTQDEQLASFIFNTSSPGNKDVFFYVTGATGYYDTHIYPVSINVPQRIISVEVPSTIVLTNTTYMSIMISAPAVTDVTVSFYAGNVQFNTSSVTFSGNQTVFAVAIYPAALGFDTIFFLVTGDDAAYYAEIAPAQISINVGTFVGPDSWYIPFLWVGVESDKLPIRASFSPINSVTLTPSAPDVIFNPPSLTFSNGTEQQYFTITPLYVSNDATYSTITVSWLATGPDHTFFSAPGIFDITVNRRTIQNKWSAHLYDNTRHLRKPYKVWSSVNYISQYDIVSVTPVSPYFSFNPSVLWFNGKTTRIEFLATPTGAPGATTVDYIIGGRDGGWYTPIPSETWDLSIRPLGIVAAVLSPDDRVGGLLYPSPSTAELASYHVYSILLQSYVLPDSSLTITPRCNHATFSPSSLTVRSSNAVKLIDEVVDIRNWQFELPGLFLQANFTVHPLAAGLQEVWFELSGGDADFYLRPPHTFVFFNQVRRPATEPASSSHTLLPSFVPILLLSAILLFV